MILPILAMKPAIKIDLLIVSLVSYHPVYG